MRYDPLPDERGLIPGRITRADVLIFGPGLLLTPGATVGLLSLAEFSAFLRTLMVNRGGESGVNRIRGGGSRSRAPDSELVPADPKADEDAGTWSRRIWSTIHDKSSRCLVDLHENEIMKDE
jgi:hypothetical protein